jgi:D-alanyl-lipoteichoic acid acyltransferase DltB (MBOAT superfamily)
MLLSREVLPDFAILFFSISFLMLYKLLWEGYLVTFIVWEQWVLQLVSKG